MVEVGTILLGKYRIECILGKGGMGVVARAHHLQLDVPVAIKFLLSEVLNEPDMVERFRREAQAVVKLKSEHVCRVIDVGTLDSGAPYMVMEFLAGRDLDDLLREHGRFPPGFAVDLILQACEALAEAHALGIVHRDIKPANFFLTEGADGVPLLKVLDFGISKSLSIDHDMTDSKAIMGTPSYMSPEQMESSKHVDARTDIWALGAVLYQLVSGRRPFRAPSFAGLVMHVATKPPRPLNDVTLPDGFEDIIWRCLVKDPAERLPNTAELAAALAPYAATRPLAERALARTQRLLEKRTSASIEQVLPIGPQVAPRDRNAATAATDGTDATVTTMAQSQGQQVPTGATKPQRSTSEPAPSASVSAPQSEGRAGRRVRNSLIGLGAAALAALILGLMWPDSTPSIRAPAASPSAAPSPPEPTPVRPATGHEIAASPIDAGTPEPSPHSPAETAAAPVERQGATTDSGDPPAEAESQQRAGEQGRRAQPAGPDDKADEADEAEEADDSAAARAAQRKRRAARRRANDDKKRPPKAEPASEKPPTEDIDLFGTRN
ncbi:MAG: hypothetical protein Tsb0020_33220 [Haliangiales bacterium]